MNKDYIRTVIDGLESARRLLREGEILHMDVRHDDWCALLNHDGECDCEPEILIAKKTLTKSAG